MQLHFYVPDDLAEAIRHRAESHGLTVSKYIAEIMRREVSSGWPAGFFEAVVGAWHGKPVERPAQGSLEERDTLRDDRA